MKTGNKDFGVAEHMKIRQYMINLIFQSGDNVRQLPPARELAKRFGVSHPTVLRALQDLLDDGFLVKQGRGRIVTRPICRFPGETLRIFGIGIGDGREVLQSKVGQMLTAGITLDILNRRHDYRLQPLILPRGAHSLSEVIGQYTFTGMVWVLPDSAVVRELRQARSDGLPAAILGGRGDGISSIGWNHEKEYYQVMSRLLDEGRGKTVVLNVDPDDRVKEQVCAGIRRACGEWGKPYQDCIILNGDDDQEMRRRLEDILSYGVRPEAVIFTGQVQPYLSLLRQSLDTRRACRLVGREFTIFKDMEFSGLIIRQRIAEAAATLLDNLILQCESPSAAPVLDGDIETVLEEV